MSLLFNMLSRLVIAFLPRKAQYKPPKWHLWPFIPAELLTLPNNTSKVSVLQHSAFFMVQISHPYMTTGKTTALTIHTFVSKVRSLLFNMQSWFVIAFLPRSKHLLISWLQSLSTVILEPKKIIRHCFHCFPMCLQ